MGFLKNTDGNLSVMAAIGSTALLTSIGVAIELSSLNKQSNYMQDSLDSAVLAAAFKMGDRDKKTNIQSYGERIFLEELMKGGFDCKVQNINIDEKNFAITAKTKCKTTAKFPLIKGMLPSGVEVDSTATFAPNTTQYEVALALDTSGSMGGRRMDSLKVSAHELIEAVIPNSGKSNVRIALVPYSSSVNAGIYGSVSTGVPDLYAHTISNLGANPHNLLNTANKTIIDESNELTANAPDGITSPAFANIIESNPDAFEELDQRLANKLPKDAQKEYVAENWAETDWSDPSVTYNMDWSTLGENYKANVGKTACVTERGNFEAFTDTSPFFHALGSKASQCPVAAIEPLTDSKEILHHGVHALRPDGGSAGHLGIAWSWYVLSPKWSNLWPSKSRTESRRTNKHV